MNRAMELIIGQNTLLLSASMALMLAIWGFYSAAPLKSLQRNLLKFPGVAIFFALVFLCEAFFANVFTEKSYITIVFIAPLIEEFARFFITDFFELEKCEEGFFTGILIGVLETLFLLATISLSTSEMLFRLLFTQPLHATQGACLLTSNRPLQLNIIVHFFFNYGLWLGGFTGIALSISALTFNLFRLFQFQSSSNSFAD
jgi:hypothetical protein